MENVKSHIHDVVQNAITESLTSVTMFDKINLRFKFIGFYNCFKISTKKKEMSESTATCEEYATNVQGTVAMLS